MAAIQWNLLDKDLVYISTPEDGRVAQISDVAARDSQQVRHARCDPVASNFTPSQVCQLDKDYIFGCSESEARIWRMGRASWTSVELLADESWLSGTVWMSVLRHEVTPQALVWHILAVTGTGRLVHLQLGLVAAAGLARVWGTTVTTQAWSCRPAVQQVVCEDTAVRVQVWSSTADGCTPSLLQYEVQCVPALRLVESSPTEDTVPPRGTPAPAPAPSSGLFSSAWSMLKDAVAVTPRGEGMGRVSSSKWIRALPKLCSQIRALLLNQPGGPLLLAACEDRAACYDTRSLLLMKLWRRRAPQVAWHYFADGPESWAAVLMVPARRTVECWDIPACELRGVFQALPGTQLAQVEAKSDGHRAQALLGTVRASASSGSSTQFAWTTAYTWST